MINIEQRIRERAYQIWLKAGRPEGRDKIHWDMATELVILEDNQEQDRSKYIRVREEYLQYWAKFGLNNVAIYARRRSATSVSQSRPRSRLQGVVLPPAPSDS